MNAAGTFAPRRDRQHGRGVLIMVVAGLLLGLLILGALLWSSSGTAPDLPQEEAEALPLDPLEQPVQRDPAARAELALREQRLFAPPGNNAFELYLEQRRHQPDDPLVAHALTDLFPYAVLHVEQLLAAGDAAESERVLGLMQQAQPDAPALPRLRRAVEDLRSRNAVVVAPEPAPADAAAETVVSAPDPAPRTPAPAPAPDSSAPPAPPVVDPPSPTADADADAASARGPESPVEDQQPRAPAPPTDADRSTTDLPTAVHRVTPRYPPAALRRGVEGSVELSFTIDVDGSVSDVKVLQSHPGGLFDREAVAAMQRWRFAPRDAPFKGYRTFDFKLADR